MSSSDHSSIWSIPQNFHAGLKIKAYTPIMVYVYSFLICRFDGLHWRQSGRICSSCPSQYSPLTGWRANSFLFWILKQQGQVNRILSLFAKTSIYGDDATLGLLRIDAYLFHSSAANRNNIFCCGVVWLWTCITVRKYWLVCEEPLGKCSQDTRWLGLVAQATAL